VLQCITGNGGISVYIWYEKIPSNTRVRVLVFNTTFNNISVISWQSVLVGIYNYLCNQSLLPLVLRRCVLDTLSDKVCQWLVTDRWFSSGILVSSTNKTDCHDITEILLKVVLNTKILTLVLLGIFSYYM
jgi:hypothetical protein